MKTIKRYQNRKLYDTEASTYVTLEDITRMIRSGEDVKVIDNKTKRDLTAVTLAQIIFEEQKKQHGILPLWSLRRIIQTGGESIQEFVEKRITPGITAVQQTQKEVEQYVERLVSRGSVSPEEARNFIAGFLTKSQRGLDELQRLFDDRIRGTMERVRGFASLQKEVARLEEKIAELETQLEEARAAAAPAPKKRGRKKAKA